MSIESKRVEWDETINVEQNGSRRNRCGEGGEKEPKDWVVE